MLGREGDLFRAGILLRRARILRAHGEMPLPPTSTARPKRRSRALSDRLCARAGRGRGAHRGPAFRCRLFAALEARGVRHAFVTLHVGAGTFQPVRVDDIERT
jgi:S-adenosylmethionine:tRNA ribosyltransferase-isomerase